MFHGIAPCTLDRMTLQNCQPWYTYLWYLSFYGINMLIHLLWQNSSIFCFISCSGSAGSIHCAQKTVSGVTTSHLFSLLILNLADEHSALTIKRVASPTESSPKIHKAKTPHLFPPTHTLFKASRIHQTACSISFSLAPFLIHGNSSSPFPPQVTESSFAGSYFSAFHSLLLSAYQRQCSCILQALICFHHHRLCCCSRGTPYYEMSKLDHSCLGTRVFSIKPPIITNTCCPVLSHDSWWWQGYC